MDSIAPLSSPSFVGSATSQGRGWNGQNQQLPALGQLLKALVVEAQDSGRFILDIGGNRLSASSSVALSQGQALQLQVVKTEPRIELKIVGDNTPTPLAGRSLTLLGKAIDLTTLIQTVRQQDSPVLEPQLLKAQIVETLNGGRAILDIGGNRFTVSSSATLSQEQALQLQVVKTEPAIELKIVGDNTPALVGRSLTVLDKGVDLTPLLQNVPQLNSPILASLTPVSRNVLESFFSHQQDFLDSKDGGAILKHLIDKLGLNLEHLLAKGDKNGASQTLKAALIELAHVFGNSEKITESAGKLIATLELFQLTQHNIGTDTHYIFPLPLPFVDQGYLMVEREEQGSAGEKNDPAERRFSLHLTMSDLGNLRVDFLRNAEGLFIRFMADSKEKADFLATFGEELKASVINTPLIGVAFSEGAPDPINDLIRKLVPEGRSMLDMKV